MSLSINRRRLLGASLLAVSCPLQAQSFWDWLSQTNTPSLIHAILARHLGLKAEHLTLMPEFIQRLKTEGAATEHPERFQAILQDKSLTVELESYVVEEFVVASNYFAFHAGEDSKLRMLNRTV